MSNDEIARLTRQLEGIRLQREEALDALERATSAEQDVIRRIRAAGVANPPLQRNPHHVGDTVRITNTLRGEYGIRGVVISSPSRLVTIRNRSTGKEYTRGWWNLERVSSSSEEDGTIQQRTDNHSRRNKSNNT